ncbi:GDSL-type esterase/lipase family protein [Lichenihabitans sp. Uapishka_5]|uniref:GDSL-type esterase/lipase family protein n=1 Tax=Lichenihabitans sp. Uapishka_5 TaxID=3037302 RepID=UPI0029E8154F|nr:GDSL-type esterase/lipase family protein [Lichenihabitans sp. Uapishka_5]MDX7950589.1 GDSL-type esterase/lipase family protein [Lichenihabitans sp. Uapishka_5]
MRRFAVSVAVMAAFCAGVVLGVTVVQLRLSPVWRLIAGVEMHVLHTDFTPNWPMLHKQALYHDNPSTMPIVMAGDSLVDYADWPALLRRSDVGNRGITGDSAEGLLQRADELAAPGATIALMIGENDLAAHQTVAATCTTVALLVRRLTADHPLILHATLLTAAPTLNGPIRELDACERRACAEAGRCTFLDLNPIMAPAGILDPALTLDGFHLNQQGYVRWADALRPVLDARVHERPGPRD